MNNKIERPVLICSICGNEFIHRTGNGCSKEYCSSCRQRSRQKRFKIKAVKHLGGKCVKCGYDKCLGALEFHHTDPEAKEFQISNCYNFSWEKVLEEVNKCILLCANCHREEHEVEEKDFSIIKTSEDIIPKKEITCPVCGKLHVNKQYCSRSCKTIGSRIAERPSYEQLLIYLETMSSEAIGKKYGVSGNCVRKWIKRYKAS